MVDPLSSWPWDNLGVYKYLLYGPLVAKVIYSKAWEEGSADVWCLHILIICALRGLTHQLWSSFSNMLFLFRRRRVLKDGIDYKQIDQEWDWDNFLILQAFIGVMVCYSLPVMRDLPRWDLRGCLIALVLHIGVSEPMFYWIHRMWLHKGHLFIHYHSIHHSSLVPHPFTAKFATPLEHLVQSVVMGMPVIGATLAGSGSATLMYGYVLLFDFLRCMVYSNVEVFPHRLFEALPILKYIVSTPTYHSLHHTEKDSNFCLFMPLFDVLGGTLNNNSWELQKEISSGRNVQAPDIVFLIHGVEISSVMHTQILFRTFASMPYSFRMFMLPLWPAAFLAMLMFWTLGSTLIYSFYNLRDRLHQTWVVPRYGFQYFLPFAKNGINDKIEKAILRADEMGVKVFALAALNKNESLNGGGMLFVNKHPDLKLRLVHGNTLTAAAVLNEIPQDVKEVFLVGATSKLGRAIALYLCRKKIRVMMLTQSTERFQRIQEEALPEYQSYLVRVTNCEAARNCKTWIVGKWLFVGEQRCASPGTHFHQFVVPPIINFRRDCTYGKLAAMRVPHDVQGLGVCEYTLQRGVVHACHAGGVVHLLEGWTHHEVGAIDVGNIDTVWKAALKHGFKPI